MFTAKYHLDARVSASPRNWKEIMAKQLEGQVAIITGAAVRMGRAIALALADEGCGIVIHYRSSADQALELSGILKERGVPAWRVQADLAEPAGPERLIKEAKAQAGRLDILINSAAIFGKQPFLESDMGSFRKYMEVNLFAPIMTTRAFVAATETGRIINMVDRRIAGHDPTCIPYLLSKTALGEFTQAAALALAPHFTVNAVGPGPALPPPGKPDSYLIEKAGKIPLERQVPPDEIARTIVHLVTSPGITGQIVFVDGGQHLLGEGV